MEIANATESNLATCADRPPTCERRSTEPAVGGVIDDVYILQILSDDGNKYIQVFCIFAVLFSANIILWTTFEISVLR